MIETKPSIPSVYDLVILETADSSRAHAERLAAAGADEGTLIWAKSQRRGIGRSGQSWMSGNRNLHCSIILRPEEDLDTCCQLSLLASICAALAISRQAEPLEELRYRWPNDVLLNQGKVAGITLSGKVTGPQVDWLVVALNVNVYGEPDSKGLKASSLRGEGFQSHDRVLLLEAYTREFLSWINRWSEEGVGPVTKEWLFRGHQYRDPVSLKIGDDVISGSFEKMHSDGSIELANAPGIEKVGLIDFFTAEFSE